MKFMDKAIRVLLLLMIGAALQNIGWYIRLQKPILLREFEMYWAADGARIFLDFNMINYIFIFIVIAMIFIFKLLDYRSSAVQIASKEDKN